MEPLKGRKHELGVDELGVDELGELQRKWHQPAESPLRQLRLIFSLQRNGAPVTRVELRAPGLAPVRPKLSLPASEGEAEPFCICQRLKKRELEGVQQVDASVGPEDEVGEAFLVSALQLVILPDRFQELLVEVFFFSFSTRITRLRAVFRYPFPYRVLPSNRPSGCARAPAVPASMLLSTLSVSLPSRRPAPPHARAHTIK